MPKNAKGKGQGSGSGDGTQRGRGRGSTPSVGDAQPPATKGRKRPSALQLCGTSRVLNLDNPVHKESILSYLASEASTSIHSSSYSMEGIAGSSSASNLQWAPIPPPSKSARQSNRTEIEESAELFQHSISDFSDKLPHDDEETQIPDPAAFTSIQSSPIIEYDEEEPVDDEYVDKNWSPGEDRQGTSTSDEEVVVRVPPQRQQSTDQIPAIDQAPEEDTTAATSVRQSQNQSSRKKKSAAKDVWFYFTLDKNDVTKVICNTCKRSLSRGKDIKHLNTNAMPRHLKALHPAVWKKLQEQQSRERDVPGNTNCPASSSPSPIACASPTATSTPTPQHSSNWLITMKERSAPRATSQFRTPAVTSRSSVSDSTFQPTLQEVMQKKKKYPATHERSKLLTACISQLLALEMVPFRFVETYAFRTLMALAVPQYVVPGRHYFARTAVPALHAHVKQQITRALKQSVSGGVHLTTDTWTSKHGQGHYLSLTAHWVNIVDTGHQVRGGSASVLPSPRRVIRRSSAVTSSPTSYSQTSSLLASSVEGMSCTPEPSPIQGVKDAPQLYRSASGLRQQAVLKLICLGDKSHNAQNIKEALIRETEAWFGPLQLDAGNVVSDNGRNLVAALKLVHLTHIPCLAHVFNLVVQGFLKQYPQLASLVEKVRKFCSHVRRSTVASVRLVQLQRKHHLPTHRLICDVPTRWNSTFHMLQRICEQQSAIVELVMMTAARRPNMTPVNLHLTAVEWAQLHDVCLVLRCFDYCTKVVSADNNSISMTVPLLSTLQNSLSILRERACVTEEEGDDFPDSQELEDLNQPSADLHHSQDGRIRQWLQSGSQSQIPCVGNYSHTEEGEEEEEEEEEEKEEDNVYHEMDVEEESLQQSQSFSCVGSNVSGIERGWGDAEETVVTLEQEDSADSPGTLSHMCDFMLKCLFKDKRVEKVLVDPDYWVATLLDPRFKDKLPDFFELTARSFRDIEFYQEKLTEGLIAAFPPVRSESTFSTSVLQPEENRVGRRGRGSSAGSTDRNKGITAQFWQSLLRRNSAPAAISNMQVSDQRQHLLLQVEEYLRTVIDVLPHDSFLMDYWVSKLEMWPELAQYALGVLSCPAASVFSERLFSTAGGVVTELRTRLSTENVDRLTFIKVNHAWICKEFTTPLPDSTL